jgi:hypothetical protein
MLIALLLSFGRTLMATAVVMKVTVVEASLAWYRVNVVGGNALCRFQPFETMYRRLVVQVDETLGLPDK